MSEAERAGFWARWSRRKREGEPAQGSKAEDAAPEGAPEADEPPAAPERPACPIPNLPAIDPASLPPIEALTAESDFSLFLRPGVPAALRGAALRRMWSLDPSIRDFIETADYQWDFNTPGGLPPGFADELVGEARKLLAQAIGRPTTEHAAGDAAEVPVTSPGVPEPPAGRQAAMVPTEEHDADLPAPVPPVPGPVELGPRDPPASPRPRHGRALPV